jgi:hypothetical protein
MTDTVFSINFDYRCPFARNANEHVVAALRAGASYDVTFKSFSLTQAHVTDGDPDVFHLEEKRPELLAVVAGIVVRDRFPEKFWDAHLSLFAIRHDDGDDIRDESKIRNALTRAGVDADAVFAEIDKGWPFDVLESEHLESVKVSSAFGVPTFIAGDEAVFVRLMTRPEGNGDLAKETIDLVMGLVTGHPELNEFKHTSIPR